MKTVPELEQLAAQLVGRVRDDEPEANARWLHTVCPDPADRDALLYVLAAAVPDDRPWSELVAWIAGPPEDRRRRQYRESIARNRARAREAA